MSQPPLKDDLASAFAWWREAGVDCEFTDDATAWLGDEASENDAAPSGEAAKPAQTPANPAISREEPKAPIVERIDLLGPNPPKTLEDFHTFWKEAPGLDAISPRGRVPPRGMAKTQLMVLVTDPEARDRDRLLDGPQGELLTQILRAMGMQEDEVYIASALPRHTPMADTAGLAAGGMDAVTAHHITLAQPKAVLALGSNILPLLGTKSPKEPASLREINLGHLPSPVMVTDGLDSLMAMPRLKARFWRRWIEWSAENL
ncbi:MAG: hypothetical protein AAGK17_06415 [Pseudomonadota bacterium]